MTARRCGGKTRRQPMGHAWLMGNKDELPLEGWTVGVTADRRSEAQLDLLTRRGAKVLHGCTMRTLDLTDDDRLAGVSEALVAEPPETLVLQTGMGTPTVSYTHLRAHET